MAVPLERMTYPCYFYISVDNDNTIGNITLNINIMKKFLSLMLILASFTALTSCSQKEKEDEIDQNPLKGTLWSIEDETALTQEKYTRYIEFSDNKNVKMWDTDRPNKISNGTYTVNENKVQFSNLHSSRDRKYTEGTFTTNTLTVKYYYLEGDNFTEVYTKE